METPYNAKPHIVDLGVPRLSRGSGTIKIKGLGLEQSRTFALFYNFVRDVLQTRLTFVLCSSRLIGGLPL